VNHATIVVGHCPGAYCDQQMKRRCSLSSQTSARTRSTSNLLLRWSRRKRKVADISKTSKGFLEPCPDSAICGVTKDIAHDNWHRNHRQLHHDPSWPEGGTPCNFPGSLLPRDHNFISREQFQHHLPGGHMLSTEQIREYIGRDTNIISRLP
jgi:hypothetical protein